MTQNEVLYKVDDKGYISPRNITYVCDFDHGDKEAEAEYSIYKNEGEGFKVDIEESTKRFSCEKHANELIQNQIVDVGLVVRPTTKEEEHKHEGVNVGRSDTTCLTVCLCGAHLKLDHHDRPFIEERNN